MFSGHPGSHSFETLNDTDQIGTDLRILLEYYRCRATSMLVTGVGDGLCWWHV